MYVRTCIECIYCLKCPCGNSLNSAACLTIAKKGKPKQTNADRIRSMSDEELAEFLENFAWDNEPTKEEIYEWLQSEVE